MSLYTMLMGRNPYSPVLLGALGITMETVEQYPLGRIRDVSTNDAADRIFILTRNYGEEWEHVDQALSKHPNYVQKYSESDETYSTYEFTVPDDTQSVVKELAELSDNTPPFKRYIQAIEDFGSGKQNEMTKHMLEAGKKIFEPLKRILDGTTGNNAIIIGDEDITTKKI